MYSQAWLSGPTSDKELRPHHGQPIHTIATKGDQAVTGSADHSLRVWDTNRGSHVRQLYTKSHGHQEWVTSCTFLDDGRIVSAGMDGFLCVWDRRSTRCETLKTHGGSISSVMVDSHNIGLSASYDKTIVIWNFNTMTPLELIRFKNPIMSMDWHNSLAVAGDRAGEVSLWDINTQKCVYKRIAHEGIVLKSKLMSDSGDCNVVMSVGKDGKLSIIDMRELRPVFDGRVHSAAINVLEPRHDSVVTAAFDKFVRVFEARMGFRQSTELESSAGILCGRLMDDLMCVGGADGNLIVFNIDSNECLFGFGCDSVGGLNCIGITPDKKKVVTGGDSGIPLLLSF